MNKILIVVDMQKDFIDGALGTKEAVSITDRAAEKIKGFDGPVLVTMDTHGQNYLQTAEGKNLPVAHCIKGTPGWELHETIQQALQGKQYTVLEKGTFGSIELPSRVAELLDPQQMEAELIGLCTDICVVSNALLLKAHFPEMQIAVDAGCCAGVTPETHNAALETMKMCQITIV